MIRGNAAGVRLPFSLLGIPVRLDYSFLLILPLFAYLIGSQLPAYAQLFQATMGIEVDLTELSRGITRWLVGLAGAIGLFASVLVHELGHAVVARLYGVEVREIRLWFLGGVAQFDEMPKQRGGEAVVAVVGPIVSFVLGFLFLRLAPPLSGSPAAFVIVGYLGFTNVALALFNLIPAIPLDGGRVLRSLLALALPPERATMIAVGISGVMAILLGLYGFFTFQLWLVVIAFFIYQAGRVEAQASTLNRAFEGKTVADLMTREPITVTPDLRLTQFLRLIHFRPHTGYPVVDGSGKLLGFARLSAAKATPGTSDEHASPSGSTPSERPGGPPASPLGAPGEVAGATALTLTESELAEIDPNATVADILEPAETTTPDTAALDALKTIAEGNLGRLVVIDRNGVVVGLLSKTDLLRELKRLYEPSTGPRV